ncbi:MAG: thioredoxin, partial [Planctomycetota bacterium]
MYEQVTTRLWRGGPTALLLLAGLALAGGCDLGPGEATVEARDTHAEGAHAGHRHEPATAVPEEKETAPKPVEKEAAAAPQVASAEPEPAERAGEAEPAAPEKKAPPAEPVAITDSGFTEAIASGVVLVDFWAPWCSWCRRLAPIIDKLAADYDGKAVVATLNTDENRSSPASYGVRGLPTVIVFKDGKEFAKLVGFRPEKDLRAVLDAAL